MSKPSSKDAFVYDEAKLLAMLRIERQKKEYAAMLEKRTDQSLYAPTVEEWATLTEFTDEQIRDMKDQGLPMPPCIKRNRWFVEVNLTETDYRVELIIQHAAAGKTVLDIAKQIKIPEERVEKILLSPAIIARIRDRQIDMFAGRERQGMRDLFPEAFTTMAEILRDKKEKSSLRFHAAAYVIDQVIGRSQQSVEVKTNLLSDILQKLEERDRNVARTAEHAEAIDVLPSPFHDLMESLEKPEVIGKRGDREQ